MAPMITLVLGSIVARIIGQLGVAYLDSWSAAIAVGLAAMFTLTSIAHFAPPLRGDLVAIVPPRLPAPGLLVSITGALELLGAAGLLLPVTRVAAALCLLILMLAMFPANIYAARMPSPPKSMTTRLSVRSAEELVFLAAAAIVATGGCQ
ncbi:DoxX family protein [Mycobacterium ulcerans]|uniref:DoxX family protein n=1 Tax=Mycobacterium ulcerans TaxID=1809 RepID=UPI0012DE2E01|nr:DoxX family protein [Mycobacterium ulcerans]MEB3970325.1 DoxX family protein [Mycobacterium ulcerans]MEB3978589.1 DoxX family protein [Mycobacterium ulcerans]MEB4007856.1 DoxX family protein [Mycobacterium ulcerans]MEB4417450.1 DoxX family protein [Mycobacterium ulcerans]MEB4435606.1 DoxX family protein [Mycobacterium ulcerans]